MSTIEKGDALEDAIYQLISRMIEDGRFFARKSCCKIFRKKPYYSKDRKSEIVFDLAVEISLPGETEPSLFYLIECKNYSDPVPVGDVEEFSEKVRQVALLNSKAVIASNQVLQSGAFEFAKSKGMGVLRYFNSQNYKWDLTRSASAWLAAPSSHENEESIRSALSDPDVMSEYFDFYCYAPHRFTNSINSFFEKLTTFESASNVNTILARCSNPKASLHPVVRYLTEEEIEDRANDARDSVQYQGGSVDLEAICNLQEKERQLTLHVRDKYPRLIGGEQVLGSLSFDPPTISIFRSGNDARDRFTLSHELGHLLLDHSEFIRREYTIDRDFSDEAYSKLVLQQLGRLEWQANFFASCLLLPREFLMQEFFQLAANLGLRDRGHGALYLDDQPVNQKSYFHITGNLMTTFGVSRTAIHIRLTRLGLLTDARKGPGVRLSSILSPPSPGD